MTPATLLRAAKDIHIKDSADLLQIPHDFQVSTWDIGRSGDLGRGVEVNTRWYPVQGFYETNTVDADEVLSVGVSERSYDRQEAYRTHARVVAELQATLAMMEER